MLTNQEFGFGRATAIVEGRGWPYSRNSPPQEEEETVQCYDGMHGDHKLESTRAVLYLQQTPSCREE